MGTLLEKKPLTEVTEDARLQAANAGMASPTVNPAPNAPVAPVKPNTGSSPTAQAAREKLIATYGSVENANAAAQRIKAGQGTAADTQNLANATGIKDAAARSVVKPTAPTVLPVTPKPVAPAAPAVPSAPVSPTNSDAANLANESGKPASNTTLTVGGKNVSLTNDEYAQYSALDAAGKVDFLNKKTGIEAGTPPAPTDSTDPRYGDRFLKADGSPMTSQEVYDYVNKEVEASGVTDPTLKDGLRADLMNSAYSEWNAALDRHATEIDEKAKLSDVESKKRLADLADQKLMAEHQAELAATQNKYKQAIQAAQTEYDTKINNLGQVVKLLGGVQSQTAVDGVKTELRRAADNINMLGQQQDLDLISLAKGYEYAKGAGDEYMKQLKETENQINQYLTSKTEQGRLDTIEGINEAKAAINNILSSSKAHGANYAAALKQINDTYEKKAKELNEKREVDSAVSEKMGYLVNKYGEAINDKNGQPIKVQNGIQSATFDKSTSSWLVLDKLGMTKVVKSQIGQPDQQDVLAWRSAVKNDIENGTDMTTAVGKIDDPNMQKAVLRSLNAPEEFGISDTPDASGFVKSENGIHLPANAGPGQVAKSDRALTTPEGTPYGQCGRYANDVLGTPNKFGDKLEDKVRQTNIKPGQGTPTMGSAIVLDTPAKTDDGSKAGHVGIIIAENDQYWAVKSANWAGKTDAFTGQKVGAQQVSTVLVPKNDPSIKGFYDPTGGAGKPEYAPVEKATRSDIYDQLAQSGINDVQAKKLSVSLAKKGASLAEVRGKYPTAQDKQFIEDFRNQAVGASKEADKSMRKMTEIEGMLSDKNATGIDVATALKSFVASIDNTAAMQGEVDYMNTAGRSLLDSVMTKVTQTATGKIPDAVRKEILGTVTKLKEGRARAYVEALDQMIGSVEADYGSEQAKGFKTLKKIVPSSYFNSAGAKPTLADEVPETGDKNDPLGFPDLLSK